MMHGALVSRSLFCASAILRQFKENEHCTSQHTHITIVELVPRLYDKTRISIFFVLNRGWLKHIHSLYVVGHRTGPGNWHNKAQCLPISLDSDVTSFLTAGPGRTINWLIKNEGHRSPDNNEVSRALPFYGLRSLDASQLASFARYYLFLYHIMIFVMTILQQINIRYTTKEVIV